MIQSSFYVGCSGWHHLRGLSQAEISELEICIKYSPIAEKDGGHMFAQQGTLRKSRTLTERHSYIYVTDRQAGDK